MMNITKIQEADYLRQISNLQEALSKLNFELAAAERNLNFANFMAEEYKALIMEYRNYIKKTL